MASGAEGDQGRMQACKPDGCDGVGGGCTPRVKGWRGQTVDSGEQRKGSHQHVWLPRVGPSPKTHPPAPTVATRETL